MIHKLQFILALAREKNFGRAAEACGVSQPTLSNGLKSLEEAFGTRLVQRSARFQGFTPEGERVLDWARRIVADAQSMRLDVDALKSGLGGHIRIAAIPTALPIVAQLTTPFRDKYPAVRFTILSRTSTEILQLIEDLQVDAGLSYLENEPLGQVRTVPLYEERYNLLTASDGRFEGRASVTWAEVASLPLCLLTPDMQNRRIVDQMLRNAGSSAEPTLVSNSTIVLVSHVKTGRWSSVMPSLIAESLGLPDSVRSLPILEPDVSHTIGLVVAHREPTTPLVAALKREAELLARRVGVPARRA